MLSTNKTLQLFICLIAFCILFLCHAVSAEEKKQAKPGLPTPKLYLNSKAETLHMPFKVNRGQVLIQAKLNRRHTGWFIMSTATPYTVIDQDIAKVFELQQIDGLTLPTNIGLQTYQLPVVRVENLAIESMDFRMPALPVSSLKHISQHLNQRISGIIGMDLLQHISFQFDWKKKQIIFYLHPTYKLKKTKYIKLETDAFGRMYCPVWLNFGEAYNCILDTGFGGTLLINHRTFNKRDPILAEEPSIGRNRILLPDGLITVNNYQIEQVKLSAGETHHIPIQVNVDRPFEFEQDGLAGLKLLEEWQVIIDPVQKRLWLPKEDLPATTQANQVITDIMPAVMNDDATLISKLLKAGLQIEVNQGNQHPVLRAVIYKKLKALQAMLEAGVSANAKDNYGTTALHLAAQQSDDSLKLLIDAKANINAANSEGQTPLHAATAYSLTNTKALIEAGANINKQDTYGLTPLMNAIVRKQTEIVRYLIKHTKSDLKVKDILGNTILFYAAENGDWDIYQLCMDHSMSPVAENNEGYTPIHAAAAKGQIRILKDLISNTPSNYKFQRSVLLVAMRNNHENVAQWLLKQKRFQTAHLSQGFTLVHLAAEKNMISILKELLILNYSVDAAGTSGITPLHLAARNGHNESIKLLLEKEINIDAIDSEGVSPAMYAAFNGHTETLKLFIKARAIMTNFTTSGNSLLHHLCQAGDYPEMVQELIKLKLSPNHTNRHGISPLMYALQLRRSKTVKVLLENGASIQGTDEQIPPLIYAINSFHHDAVATLLKAGAKLEVTAMKQYTPMTFAASTGDLASMQILHKAGASLTKADATGQQPLHYAVRFARADIVEWLLKQGVDTQLKFSDDRDLKTYARHQKDTLIEKMLP